MAEPILLRTSKTATIRADALKAIKEWGEPITSLEICSLIGVDSRALCPRLSELVSCGLVLKEGSAGDGFTFKAKEETNGNGTASAIAEEGPACEGQGPAPETDLPGASA